MTEKYFPFDAVEVEGMPDRVYYSEDFACFFGMFVGNGVFPNPSDNLKITSNGNMTVTATKGYAFINGRGYVLLEDMAIQLDTANASYNRKDIIVVSLNLVDRDIKIKYKAGVANANPQEPELVRSSDVHELKLASITVRSGTQQVTHGDITDTRLDAKVCGIVDNLVQSVDTTELFNQYQAYWDSKTAEWASKGQQQELDWQEQMDAQQSGYVSLKGTIEEWYNGAKVDIATLQSFNFDNLLELKGTTYTESKDVTGAWTTTIMLGSRKVAERVSHPKDGAGKFVTDVKVYKEDGQAILKEATITEYKDTDGRYITEVK